MHRIFVGIGEILWDLLPSGKRLGGAPANFAYHAGQLGAENYVISNIGQDEYGNEMVQALRDLNLSLDYIHQIQAPTGTVGVQLDEKGTPSYQIHENVAWDYIKADTAALEIASKADVLCFGSLAQRNKHSRDAIKQLLQVSKSSCLRVFDMNLRQQFYSKEILSESMKLANILKLNDEELDIIADYYQLTEGKEKRMEKLATVFELDLVILTQGVKGSMLWKSGEIHVSKTQSANMVDSVGAGDSFTAAATTAYLSGKSLAEINACANKMAAFVCTQSGAMPKIPMTLGDEVFNQL